MINYPLIICGSSGALGSLAVCAMFHKVLKTGGAYE